MTDEQVTFKELIAFRQRPVASIILGLLNLAALAGMLWIVL